MDTLEPLARRLRLALAPIVEEIAGPRGTPALLVRRLEIDRSLAGRLSRALRSEQELEFLHLVPSPTGLRIILDAASRRGAERTLLEIAQACVDEYHALIDETPGGRATINAAISAHSSQARERNERSARQAVYKGMSYLLGLQCDGDASCFVMQPSEDGTTVDCLDVTQKVAIRRLRPTSPIGLFGHKIQAEEPDAAPPVMTTLEGGSVSDPEDLIVREYSSSSLPNLEEYSTGPDTVTIALAEDEPTLSSEFTMSLGWRLRGVFRRYRNPEVEGDCRAYMASFPCRTLVRDVFLRNDLHVGITPEVSQYLPRQMRPELVRRNGQRGQLDRVDVDTPVVHLGIGLGNADVAELPTYANLVRHAFATSGWDPGNFRGYRVKLTYPVPLLYMSWWFALPAPPSA